ncbi:MAG: type III restriction endonuclease subunit R, partial [Candidatus Atribacteria bacterium]|nr:type III restriction endonuclease subunit R [Candidatus Atribacteria bacterium]
DKRGAKSDEAYVREVLGELANSRNIVIINDEAHHAWRVPAESKVRGLKKEEIEEATKWIGGLDRIHRARGILSCYDFSATPFAPSGKKSSEEALFDWIVSDFGLNDAIESGLVKTPQVVVRDDATIDVKIFKSKLYHIYEHVKDDINRKAEEHENLPDLIINAYYLLGKDWLETKKIWEEKRCSTPPVMISVANRVETAARLKYMFDHKMVLIDDLCVPEKTIHIDSKVLDMAESQEEPIIPESIDDEENGNIPPKHSKKEEAELLRLKVDTVGKIGKPGEQIQNIISVGMLSEGWDAKTVTHIMGLRAFSSQLLCEQVIGRGLRRTSYEVNRETGLFDAEYVNIFGVPFTYLPHEGGETTPPPPPTPKIPIEPDPDKKKYEIIWPNVIRIEHAYRPSLSLDLTKVKYLELNAFDTPTLAEMAPIVDGNPDITKISKIDLEELGRTMRMQRIVFSTARDVYAQMQPNWKGNKEYLLAQLIHLVESFLFSNKIEIVPPLFFQDELRRRIIYTLSMKKIVQHIWEAIRFENTEEIIPVFDSERPIWSTSYMRTWYTGKPFLETIKSHINLCVIDSGWEGIVATELDRNPYVTAWVKNDHLGFEIFYFYNGQVHKYRPDFIIKLSNNTHLILEVKGVETQRDKTKHRFLDEWVKAVNQYGGFGKWNWAISKNPAAIKDILTEHIR